LNNVIWRSLFDCRRNSVFALAATLFSKKELMNLGTTAMLKKMKSEKNVDWEDCPNEFKYGTFVKKEMYEKEAEDYHTKETISVKRTRLLRKSFKLDGHNDANIDLLFRKYW